MALTQEERRERRRNKRMAGERLNEGTPAADEAAEAVIEAASPQSEGFRNANEQRLGKEEYSRLSAGGGQDLDSKGRMSGKEVIAEMRGGRDGKTTEEMADYYQGLADSGTTFNPRAQKFLSERHGVTFGGGGNGGGDDAAEPAPTPPPGPGATPGPDPTPSPIGIPTPVPNPDPFPPIPGIPGIGGGFSVGRDLNQNIGKVGDTNTTIGDGNDIGAGATIGGDYSTTIGSNTAGNNSQTRRFNAGGGVRYAY